VLKHDIAAVESLIAAGGDVNTINFYGDSLLNVATRLGDVKMAEMLLGAGADPTIKGRWGDTALEIAASNKYKEMTSILEAKYNIEEEGKKSSSMDKSWAEKYPRKSTITQALENTPPTLSSSSS
jgi:ankyrin repeat protein